MDLRIIALRRGLTIVLLDKYFDKIYLFRKIVDYHLTLIHNSLFIVAWKYVFICKVII